MLIHFLPGNLSHCCTKAGYKAINSKALEVNTGIVPDSVYLKLYKRKWTNDLNAPLAAEARIFFSVGPLQAQGIRALTDMNSMMLR